MITGKVHPLPGHPQVSSIAPQASVFCLSDTAGGDMAALYFDSFEHVWVSSAPLG